MPSSHNPEGPCGAITYGAITAGPAAVSLDRDAMHQDSELVPLPERLNTHFNVWLAQTDRRSRAGGNPESFTAAQLHWLEMIRDDIAANLAIELADFEYAPFAQKGGLGKVHQLFGAELPTLIECLDTELAA